MNSTVLVVDDDPVSVHLLEIILERLGYQVIVAGSGVLGLELASEMRPNAIIIDDMMPGMTGGEMCLALKNDPALQDIPVVLISAGSRVQNPSYVKKVGADYALVKPILSRDVYKVLQGLLSR